MTWAETPAGGIALLAVLILLCGVVWWRNR
jgi:hypothetical protein